MPIILVVEDHVDIVDLVAEMLGQLNYEVRTALTAAEASRSVGERRPDAILLDILLPDASGTAGLDQLRKLAPTVPIIMLTGNSDVILARDTLKRGAFDYIMKPFGAERLRSVLEAALGV